MRGSTHGSFRNLPREYLDRAFFDDDYPRIYVQNTYVKWNR